MWVEHWMASTSSLIYQLDGPVSPCSKELPPQLRVGVAGRPSQQEEESWSQLQQLTLLQQLVLHHQSLRVARDFANNRDLLHQAVCGYSVPYPPVYCTFGQQPSATSKIGGHSPAEGKWLRTVQ